MLCYDPKKIAGYEKKKVGFRTFFLNGGGVLNQAYQKTDICARWTFGLDGKFIICKCSTILLFGLILIRGPPYPLSGFFLSSKKVSGMGGYPPPLNEKSVSFILEKFTHKD